MTDLRQWLDTIGLAQHAELFEQHDIDVDILPELTEQDLESIGISLGHRKKLMRAIKALRGARGGSEVVPALPSSLGPEPPRAGTENAERRQLTVLFCDLVGSTDLSTRLDPEELREVIRAYQDCCAQALARFGGHVARFLGDGVLAYFGYPRAHEEDAEWAVRAGLELIDAIGRLRPSCGTTLQARIGIATGLVVVGDLIGEGASQEQAVVGETPHLAARLQTLAEPGMVVISSATQELVRGFFDYADLGRHHLKGFAAPVQAWQVVGIGATRNRFEALHREGLTPLVGREHELGLIQSLWQQAAQGEGQVVLIAGEAGIGKSRLTRAVHERLRQHPHNLLRYNCSRFYTNSPLYPVIDGLERAAGFASEDRVEAKLDKLEQLMGKVFEPAPELAQLLASMLSIPTEGRYPLLALSSERQKEKTFEALFAQLTGLTARRPSLLVFEDLHWIDPTSLELLDRLVRTVQNLPLLALFTFRPEFGAGWAGLPHITEITLNRLGRRQGSALVAKVVNNKQLPSLLVDQIVAKADGVPLFVEELTKTIIASGFLTDLGDRYEISGKILEPAIPASLQDSLMARLDRLGPAKEVAQIGAVIGREFSYGLLAALCGLQQAVLERALAELADAGLVQALGVPPQASYTFKHALVQDAAYQSLLKSRRQGYHRRIVHLLPEMQPEASKINPELLAYHAAEAGLYEQAITYRWMAGRKAMGRSAHQEAIAHLQTGLSLLKNLPEGDAARRQELQLRTALGHTLMATKGYAAKEVEAAFGRARDLCLALGDSAQMFSVLAALRLFHATRGDWRMARELGEQCLELAERGQDPRQRLHAHQAVGITLVHTGELTSARSHLERAVALYDAAQRRSLPSLQDPKVDCLSFGAWTLWLLGYPDQALQRDEAALAFARERGHPFSLAFAFTLSAALHHFRREPEQQQARADDAGAIAREHGFAWLQACATILRASARCRIGDGRQALDDIRRGLDDYRATGAKGQLPYLIWLWAEASWQVGELGEAVDMALEEAQTVAEQNLECWWVAEIHRLRGDVELARGGCERTIEAWYERAQEIARLQEARSLELRAATCLCRLWQKQGKKAEASRLLAPMQGWFAEGLGTEDVVTGKDLLRTLA